MIGRRLAAAALVAAFFMPAAEAQRSPVYQSGTAVPNTIARFATNGMISPAPGRSGDVLGQGLQPLGIQDALGFGWCSNSGSTLPGTPYTALCAGHKADGTGIISFTSLNGAADKKLIISAPDINFVTDGGTYPLGNVGTANLDFSNAVLPGARINLGIPSVTPREFGAVCDGQSHPLSAYYGTIEDARIVYPRAGALTDELDATAINAAADRVRTLLNDGKPVHYSLPSLGDCLANIGIDLTMLRSTALDINAFGTRIITTAKDKVAIDTLGSLRIKLRGLDVYSPDQSTAPLVGIQSGRYELGGSPDGNGSSNVDLFEGVEVRGYYTRAAYYNVSGEGTTPIKSVFQNQYPGAYACIYDGINHFGVNSDYVAVTLPTETASSMTNTSSMSMECRNPGGGPALWMSGVNGSKFTNCYLFALGADHIIEFYSYGSPSNNRMIEFDNCNFETNSTQHLLRFTGPNTEPRHNGLKIKAAGLLLALDSTVFAVDPGIDTVYLNGIDIQYTLTFFNTTMPWDDPSKYVVSSGNFIVPSILQWQNPGQWLSGKACFSDLGILQTRCSGDPSIISSSGTASAVVTGTGSQIAAKSVRLPRLAAGDKIRIQPLYSKHSGALSNEVQFVVSLSVDQCTAGQPCTAGVVLWRGVMNSVADMTANPIITAHVDASGLNEVYINPTVTAGVGQAGFPEQIANLDSGAGLSVNFTCQLITNTADTCKLVDESIEIIPGK